MAKNSFLKSIQISKKTAFFLLTCTYAGYAILSFIGIWHIIKLEPVLSFWILVPAMQVIFNAFILYLLIRKVEYVRKFIQADLVISILYLPLSFFLYGITYYFPIAVGHFKIIMSISSLLIESDLTIMALYMSAIAIYDVFLLCLVVPSLRDDEGKNSFVSSIAKLLGRKHKCSRCDAFSNKSNLRIYVIGHFKCENCLTNHKAELPRRLSISLYLLLLLTSALCTFSFRMGFWFTAGFSALSMILIILTLAALTEYRSEGYPGL